MTRPVSAAAADLFMSSINHLSAGYPYGGAGAHTQSGSNGQHGAAAARKLHEGKTTFLKTSFKFKVKKTPSPGTEVDCCEVCSLMIFSPTLHVMNIDVSGGWENHFQAGPLDPKVVIFDCVEQNRIPSCLTSFCFFVSKRPSRRTKSAILQ